MSSELKETIRKRINHPNFLSELVGMVAFNSNKIQEDFFEKITDSALIFRKILDEKKLIKKVNYNPEKFWKFDGKDAYAFIDGGVAQLKISTAAPVGIRVGAYIVKPGNKSEDRERFYNPYEMITDLYDTDGLNQWYEDNHGDFQKLSDGSRIILESASCNKIMLHEEDVKMCFLQGPLVQTAAPYAGKFVDDLPILTKEKFFELLPNIESSYAVTKDDRSLVGIYRHILNSIKEVQNLTFGIVERPSPRSPGLITENLLEGALKEKFNHSDATEWKDTMRLYNINDSNLFSLILDVGEYISPIEINRQLPKQKWAQWCYDILDRYPNCYYTYLKTSDHSLPLRIESMKVNEDYFFGIDFILHQARLLPKYSFPVGLDIVDKYAKVPSYMSKNIGDTYKLLAYRHALQNNDNEMYKKLNKMFMTDKRDFFKRPKS